MADAIIEVPDDAEVLVDDVEKPNEIAPATNDAPTEIVVAGAAETQSSDDESARENEARETLSQAVKAAEDARKAAELAVLTERRRAEEASALAQQRGQEAQAYKEQVEERELSLVNNGIDSAKRELELAQYDVERFLEAGEFSKVAAAQVRVSQAASALGRLEDAKFNYESTIKNRVPHEGAVLAPSVPSSLSPVEQYLSTNNFTASAKAWLRAHPECVPVEAGGDYSKNAAMMEGHYAARRQGIVEGSPEYYRTIEEYAGYREPKVTAAPVQAKAKPKALPSAPVSREAPAGNVSRGTRSVTLSAEEQEAAKISFPEMPQQQAFALYAKNKIAIESEKMLGRTTH